MFSIMPRRTGERRGELAVHGLEGHGHGLGGGEGAVGVGAGAADVVAGVEGGHE